MRPNLGVLQIGIKSQGYREPGFHVTYTAISSPFGGLLDIGSPGVDGLPMMPEDPYAYVVAAFQAPPSPDYVPGPEYPPLPEFVPKPRFRELWPPEDEVFPVEEQPLPAATSCTADSPGYVPESDPEEGDDEDPEEDPADYPADGGDDDDDEDESSDDDEDNDDVDIEEEEDEHLPPVDSTSVSFPVVEHAPSAEETEPFETDESAATPPPHPAYRVTARISIRPQTLIPSSPLPPILSPLLVSSPLPVLPPLPLAPPPLPSRLTVVTLPASKRLGIALSPRYKVGESSSAPTARPPGGFRADYWFHLCIWTGDYAGSRERCWLWDLQHIEDEMTQTRSIRVITKLQAADRRRQATITKLLAADHRRQAAITELLAADRKRQAQFIEALKLLKRLQTQMTEFERQQGPAKGPAQPDAPKEAGWFSHPAPAMRSNTAPETTTTTTVTNAQLQAMIDQGVTTALAKC
ncbi:hypothetical protein Tco_0406926 [Tanacetum coccineum]